MDTSSARARRRPRSWTWWVDERGSASTELVIATPLLGLLVLLIVQFALWWHATHIAQAAAAQALAAARAQHATDAAGHAHAEAVLSQLGQHVLLGPRVTVARQAGDVRVTVTGSAEALLPGLSLPVSAAAQGPVERFTSAGAFADVPSTLKHEEVR